MNDNILPEAPQNEGIDPLTTGPTLYPREDTKALSEELSQREATSAAVDVTDPTTDVATETAPEDVTADVTENVADDGSGQDMTNAPTADTAVAPETTDQPATK